MLLEHVQVINDHDRPKFVVIDFEEYMRLKELLFNEEQLEDYLDFLHIQNVKAQSTQTYTFDEVKQQLEG